MVTVGAPHGGGSTDGEPDAGTLAIVAHLAALAPAAQGRALVVGIVGSVAVGKSTFAEALAEQLAAADQLAGDGAGRVEVVATDAFLLPNEQLEPMGGAMVKGHPPSYDWAALERFLRDAHGGAPSLATPVYSHRSFDVVPGLQRVFPTPEVVLVEGLNLLQSPPVAPVDLRPWLDCALYLHAPAEVVEQWFVDRFVGEVAAAVEDPESFYAAFATMEPEQVDSVAQWTWHEINRPNLERNIAPTRERAHVVVHLGRDHSVQRIEHQHRTGR